MTRDIRPGPNQAADLDDLAHIPVRPFHTVKQAADVLQFTPRHVYRLLQAGELEAYKFGEVWRISHKKLLAYIILKRR